MGDLMGLQNRITESCDLLNENGHLTHPGYATRPLWRYDRKKIKAAQHRIKEWDYYYVMAPELGYGITFTIADLGYVGMAAVCWLDFNQRTSSQVDTLSFFPMGRLNLPSVSDSGITRFKNKTLGLSFEVADGVRRLVFETQGPAREKLKGNILLTQAGDEDMVIATSWKENPKAFYYNHKINCMDAEGWVTLGSKRYEFRPGSAFAGLDWGRGNWTYKNRWYWGAASGMLGNDPLGWNLGYGFSDRTPASENMVFYKGNAHKLDEIVFHMDVDDYMKPWKISSSDNRFDMDFVPLLDRESAFDFKLMKSIQHQVFGHFTGRITLDDGTVLEVKDFFGFAEDVLNWW